MLRLFVLLALAAAAVSADQVKHARAFLFEASAGNPPGKLVGTIDLFQEGGSVRVNGTIDGLTTGKHGFHVHEKGDLSNGCLGAGGHYNPFGKQHGAPTATERHVGDLGNVLTAGNGATSVDIKDTLISLNGVHSVLGRAIVVHEKADDLGLGGTPASLTTGDAGARVACGVIAIVDEEVTGSSGLRTFLGPLAAVLLLLQRIL